MWGKKSDIYVCTGMRGYGIYIVKGDKDRKRGRCLLDVIGIANTPLDPYIHIYIYIHPHTSPLPYPNKPHFTSQTHNLHHLDHAKPISTSHRSWWKASHARGLPSSLRIIGFIQFLHRAKH